MNHFFALELSEEARRTIYEAAEEWRPLVARSSWYAPADYHLTLKFLGNIGEAEQPRLIEAAWPIAEVTERFLIRAASFGGFPNMAAPNVLWAGIEISLELDKLAAELNQAMAKRGFPADHRRYQPHVTIARCRPSKSNGVDWPLATERLFADFAVTRFVLMQTLPPESRANGTKARYNTVHTFPFGNARSSDI